MFPDGRDFFFFRVNHIWNLTREKKIKEGLLWLSIPPSPEVPLKNSRAQRTLVLRLQLLPTLLSVLGNKVLAPKLMLGRIFACLRSHSYSWAKMGLEPGFSDSQPVFLTLQVALSNDTKNSDNSAFLLHREPSAQGGQ